MKTVTQPDRIEAARYLGVHLLSGLRHAALRLALLEFHEKAHPDRARVVGLAERFKLWPYVEFYASRPEFWKP